MNVSQCSSIHGDDTQRRRSLSQGDPRLHDVHRAIKPLARAAGPCFVEMRGVWGLPDSGQLKSLGFAKRDSFVPGVWKTLEDDE